MLGMQQQQYNMGLVKPHAAVNTLIDLSKLQVIKVLVVGL